MPEKLPMSINMLRLSTPLISEVDRFRHALYSGNNSSTVLYGHLFFRCGAFYARFLWRLVTLTLILTSNWCKLHMPYTGLTPNGVCARWLSHCVCVLNQTCSEIPFLLLSTFYFNIKCCYHYCFIIAIRCCWCDVITLDYGHIIVVCIDSNLISSFMPAVLAAVM